MLIITGCSSNHYQSQIQFLDSVKKFGGSAIKIVVWNLGLTTNEWNDIKNKFPECVFKIFDYSKYPNYFNIKVNRGEYAWKPVLIYLTYLEMKDSYDIFLWCDAGNLVVKDITPVINKIKNSKIYVSCADKIHTSRRWNHPKCVEAFSKKGLKISPNYVLRQAGLVGFNTSFSEVIKLMKDWSDYAQKKEFIAPEGSSRTNHRQDQSVLNFLIYNFPEEIIPIELNEILVQKDIDNRRLYSEYRNIVPERSKVMNFKNSCLSY